MQKGHRLRLQTEHSLRRTGHRGIRFPAGKHGNAARGHRLLHHFRGAGEAPAGKPRVNRRKHLGRDRGFSQWQQQGLFALLMRALRMRIEAADGLHFIAEELNAHRPLRFRREHVEDAAAQGIFSRHLHHISGRVADSSEVRGQHFHIEALLAAHRDRQPGVVLGVPQPHGRGSNGNNHHRSRAGRHLPQRAGADLLNVRMRREVLKGQHVIRRQLHHACRIGHAGQLAKGSQHRQHLIRRAIVGHQHSQRLAQRSMQQRQM